MIVWYKSLKIDGFNGDLKGSYSGWRYSEGFLKGE
jgi:hypothetical protein